MAWVTPPTFIDGQVLSASVLNILSENLAHLKGHLDTQNMPFQSFTAVDDEWLWYWIRHKHQYFHWKSIIQGGETSEFTITIWDEWGTNLYTPVSDTNDYFNTPASYAGSIDVSGLNVGQWYSVRVRMDFAPGNTDTRHWDLIFLKEATYA